MFYNFQSHSLTNLAKHFSQNCIEENNSPLQPSWVIIQNNEIKEWLSLQYAHVNGIAGNFRFIFPSEFIWILYRVRNKTIPEVLPGDLNSMIWTIFELLSSNKNWLNDAHGINIDLNSSKKIFQFSSQIADLFDQYQVYRPDMLEYWLDGKYTTGYKDEAWQAEIWKQLSKYWNSSDQTKNLPRRSQAHSEILHWIEDENKELLNNIPKHLYAFGLSQISKPFSEIITGLSRIIDVHYYLNMPNIQVAETEKQNVISSWKKSVDNQRILIEEGISKTKFDVAPIVIDDNKKSSIPDFKLHSCHNQRREVQILKDEILRFLDANPSTNPSDILVMVPDPDIYAGLIETVFEKNNEEPGLPISGLRSGRYESAEHTLLELLSLLDSSFKADELLQFMHLESIKKQFNLSESDLDIIENWVVSNKIHYGLGNQFNTPYSWNKGLNQLISGFIMETDGLGIYKGLIPDNSVYSSEQLDLAAKLSELIHGLNWAQSIIQSPKNSQSWIKFAEELVKRFIGIRSSEQLKKKLSILKQQIAYSTGSEALDFQIFNSWINTILDDQNSASGRFGNGITVSTYVPYRSVPFKFIAMLGMDEGTFPRKAIRPDYDLIYAKPKAGDRVLKEDDTYLFLETLQAAESQLHLSYIGNDQNTDAKRLPSILIQQLSELLNTTYEDLSIKHGLHPFNKMYFDLEERRTYSRNHYKIASKLKENKPALKPEFLKNNRSLYISDKELTFSVYNIISFFTHPSKYLAENVLDIKNYDRFNQIEGRELFKLKGLDRYKLDDLLFNHLGQNKDTNKVFEYAKASAMIPAALPGEKLFIQETKGMKSLVDALGKITAHNLESVEINLKSDNHIISGNIDGVSGNLFISYRVGKRRAKHEIDHWIKHLMLLQNGANIEKSIYLSVEDNDIDTLTLCSDKISELTLNDLLEWFTREDITKSKIAFFPESSKAYAQEFIKNGNLDSSLEKAKNEWVESNFNPFAESADYYNKLVWRNDNPLDREAFKKNAIKFWEPFFKSIEDGNE